MTGLDSNFDGEPLYTDLSFSEGPEVYDELIQRRTDFAGQGLGVVFEDEVFIDEYNTYRGLKDWWDIELEDIIGVPFDEREDYDYFICRFADSTSTYVMEPFLNSATSDMIQYVSQFILEFDVGHNARIIWYVDDERRVRIGVREFLSRTQTDYDPYLDERYR